MPELPEVETLRRFAHQQLVGKQITDAFVGEDDIVLEGVDPSTIRDHLLKRRVSDTGRRGKHLWLVLDRRPWLLLHMGMSGTLDLSDAEASRDKYCKLELIMDDDTRLRFTNKRRLGRLRLREDPLSEPPVSELGYDPLIDLPKAEKLAQIIQGRSATLKGLMLDQGLFAGVGNWVADEVLYQAGLDPHRRGRDLSTQEVKTLRGTLLRVVKKACEVGADAERFPSTWLFQHRWGKKNGSKTSKGHEIRHDTIAGRTTAWVPAVQH